MCKLINKTALGNCEGQTDGRAIAYSALYAMLSRACTTYGIYGTAEKNMGHHRTLSGNMGYGTNVKTANIIV